VTFAAVSPGIARLEHDGLPRRSFRTYHPGYLRRARKWGALDEIVARAQAN
jgi:hypothetical protein